MGFGAGLVQCGGQAGQFGHPLVDQIGQRGPLGIQRLALCRQGGQRLAQRIGLRLGLGPGRCQFLAQGCGLRLGLGQRGIAVGQIGLRRVPRCRSRCQILAQGCGLGLGLGQCGIAGHQIGLKAGDVLGGAASLLLQFRQRGFGAGQLRGQRVALGPAAAGHVARLGQSGGLSGLFGLQRHQRGFGGGQRLIAGGQCLLKLRRILAGRLGAGGLGLKLGLGPGQARGQIVAFGAPAAADIARFRQRRGLGRMIGLQRRQLGLGLGASLAGLAKFGLQNGQLGLGLGQALLGLVAFGAAAAADVARLGQFGAQGGQLVRLRLDPGLQLGGAGLAFKFERLQPRLQAGQQMAAFLVGGLGLGQPGGQAGAGLGRLGKPGLRGLEIGLRGMGLAQPGEDAQHIAPARGAKAKPGDHLEPLGLLRADQHHQQPAALVQPQGGMPLFEAVDQALAAGGLAQAVKARQQHHRPFGQPGQPGIKQAVGRSLVRRVFGNAQQIDPRLGKAPRGGQRVGIGHAGEIGIGGQLGPQRLGQLAGGRIQPVEGGIQAQTFHRLAQRHAGHAIADPKADDAARALHLAQPEQEGQVRRIGRGAQEACAPEQRPAGPRDGDPGVGARQIRPSLLIHLDHGPAHECDPSIQNIRQAPHATKPLKVSWTSCANRSSQARRVFRSPGGFAASGRGTVA